MIKIIRRKIAEKEWRACREWQASKYYKFHGFIDTADIHLDLDTFREHSKRRCPCTW